MVAVLRGIETDVEDSVGRQCFLFAEFEGCAGATNERSGCNGGETHCDAWWAGLAEKMSIAYGAVEVAGALTS